MYRNTTNVEREMYDYTSNNWSHWNSNEKLKKKFGSCTRKTFDRFTTKDSYTWNITHNTESTAVWSLSGGDHRWLKRCTRKKKPVTTDIHIIRVIIIIIIMYLYLSVEIYLFIGLLVVLYMNQIQVLWSVNIRNFKSYCCTVLFVESLQLLTNTCTYTNST